MTTFNHTLFMTNDRKTTQKQIIIAINIITITKKEEDGGEFIGSYSWED